MVAVASFVDAIEAGLGHAPESSRIRPGEIVRFSTNGRRGDSSGWAVLFADEQGGVFGDWRTGREGSWKAHSTSRLSMSERLARSLEVERLQQQHAAEQARQHEAAAAIANEIWNAAPLCVQHEYALRKNISVQGLRLQRGHMGGCAGAFYVSRDQDRPERLKGDLLLVPMYGEDRRLWSLQAIDNAGRKSFLKGGRTRGLFHLVGRRLLKGVDCAAFRGDVAIAEGLATAATVCEISSIPVFTAFNAGNLSLVAKTVRQRLPFAQITITGDVDASGVGQTKAEEAARFVNGYVSFPSFTPEERAAGATDWNDFARLHPQPTEQARQA